MFCIHCGKKIVDTAKFCNYCGGKVEIAEIQTKTDNTEPVPEQPLTEQFQTVQEVQPVQEIQPAVAQQFQPQNASPNNAPPQNGYPQYQQFNAPPVQPVSAPPFGKEPLVSQYKNLKQVPASPLFFISILLMIVTFVGLFLPWLNFELKVVQSKHEQSAKLFDMVDPDIAESDQRYDYVTYLKGDYSSISSFQEKEAQTATFFHTVMWIMGILGYISSAIALILAIFSKDKAIIFNLLAVIQFLIALISGFMCCNIIRKHVESRFGRSTSILDVSFYPSYGIYISLIACVIAALCMLGDRKARKRMVNSKM